LRFRAPECPAFAPSARERGRRGRLLSVTVGRMVHSPRLESVVLMSTVPVAMTRTLVSCVNSTALPSWSSSVLLVARVDAVSTEAAGPAASVDGNKRVVAFVEMDGGAWGWSLPTVP
jgi:hypothetical protein